MRAPVVRTRLDVVTLGTTAAYLTASALFRYGPWALGAETAGGASGAGGEFAADFSRRTDAARLVLFPLGTLTLVLVVAGLAREGGVGASRGLLRLVAAVALVLSGIGTAAMQPLEREIVAAAAAGSAAIGDLLRAWRGWERLLFIGTAVAAGAVVLADRAPRPAPATHVLGTLTRRQYTLLALLGTATLFEGYDRFILSLALPHIARDLGAGEGSLGTALAIIRAGAFLAIVLGRLADRFGRRPLLLVTIVGYTIATAATGLSRGLIDLVAFQIVAMGFLTAELSLAQVVIAEEYPPEARGAGQGHLGAAAALGAGLAAILFPVLVRTTIGWRGLYFVGILPLLLVAYLRRTLPETDRWRRVDRERLTRARMRDLLQARHRRVFLPLVAVTVAATAAAGSAFAFHSYRATEVLGWPPERISLMILVGGGLGFWGWMFFGWLADRIGRRPVGVLCLIGGGAAIALFYRSSHLMVAFTAIVFFESGVTIAINALATELFPTHLRATAKSWITNVAVIGAMGGLALVGLLAERLGGHGPVIALLALAPMALAPLLLVLPDTHGLELEAISGRDA
jgi:putative MFS transporter